MQKRQDEKKLRRLVDDGGPLSFMQPDGSARDGEGLMVYTSACDNPDCPCPDLHLRACPARRTPGGKVEVAGDSAIRATLDVATMALSVEQDSGDAAGRDADLVDWLREAVASHAALLAQRRARIRGEADPDQWRRQDLLRLLLADSMVTYWDAFPDSWDLTLPLDGRWYWAIDYYCLNPGCDCKEVVLELTDRSDEHDGDPHLGEVRVELGRWKEARVEGGETARRVWRRLLGQKQRGSGRSIKAELRRRYKQMRRVADKLDMAVAEGLATQTAGGVAQGARPAGTSKQHGPGPGQRAVRGEPKRRRSRPGKRAGRNEACPCGSGKKYKRCCLKKS